MSSPRYSGFTGGSSEAGATTREVDLAMVSRFHNVDEPAPSGEWRKLRDRSLPASLFYFLLVFLFAVATVPRSSRMGGTVVPGFRKT